jgi:hypothetical protein
VALTLPFATNENFKLLEVIWLLVDLA